MPPAETAVHVMLDAAGAPVHEAVNAEAELTAANDSISAALAIEIPIFRNLMFLFLKPYNAESIVCDPATPVT
jgi:hypothetical protein